VLVPVREEDVRYDSASPLKVQIELVEPIFSQRVQLAHFTLGDRRLVALLPEEVRLQVGDRLPVAFPEEALHLFDAETELRLPES
jgi:ABC-type sugar transport system ATPase subunit